MTRFKWTHMVCAVVFLLAACAAVGGSDGPATDPAAAETPGAACGGIAGLTCGDDEYCDYGLGNCRMADAMGECKPKTPMCTREYRPVCGCDGKTYGNACTAGAAGVSILYNGECSTES